MVMDLDGRRLTNFRLADGSRSDLVVNGGRIAFCAPEAAALGAPVVDLEDCLVLPGLVEGHLHLDKTLLGSPWCPHDAQPSVQGRVAFEKTVRQRLDVPVTVRADALLRRCLAAGTTRVRTHVDIDELVRLDNLAAILEVREEWRDRIDIEIVAFPQSGILHCPPARGLLDDALRMGADLVGGLDPHGFDGDIQAPLDAVFGLAEAHGRGIDIHLHDAGEAGLQEIEEIAGRTRAAGLSGQVTISHAFALADAAPDRFDRIAEGLREAGVAIVSSIPGGANCPPVLGLRERGVSVFLGSDNVRDAWNPATTVGMIDRMMLCTYRLGLRRDGEIASLLDLVTSMPRRVMGCEVPLTPDGPADFIVVRAEHVPAMIVERQVPVIVVKRGRVVHVAPGAPSLIPASFPHRSFA